MKKLVNNTEKYAHILIYIGASFLLLSIIMFAYKQSIFIISNPANTKLFSEFGSFVGGLVGSIWALAGILFFYSALRVQKNEMTENIRVLTIQQFENTFFNLLTTQQNITENLSDLVNEGRLYFKQIKSEFCELLESIYKIIEKSEEMSHIRCIKRYKIDLKKPRKNHFTSDHELVKFSYKTFFNFYHYQLGHYFRHLFHIFKYIDSVISDRSRKDKNAKSEYQKYFDIVQAQMSSYELFFLFYNCIAFEKMKEYADNYKLLENLAEEDLYRKEHKNLIPKMKIKSRIQIIDNY